MTHRKPLHLSFWLSSPQGMRFTFARKSEPVRYSLVPIPWSLPLFPYPEICPTMRYRTQFLLPVTDPAQFPTSGAPEIAFLGRSNVGKSSLLNALVGEKAAKVSSTPGRTRAINFFALTNAETPETANPRAKIVFADLPGYGYAKISKSISSTWPAFIEPYLAERPQLRLCICLVDAKIPAQESDHQLLSWLRHTGRAFAVVGTKADRLSGNERTRSLAALKRDLEADNLFLISSKTGFGLKTLWQQIETAAQEA